MIIQEYALDEFDRDAEELAKKINKARFANICGIPQGGLAVAARLSHLLGLPLITEKTDITKDTIVCDDVARTGKTFREWVGEISPKPLFVTLFFDPRSLIRPDIFLHMVDNDKVWILFPWETKETTFSKS